MSENDVLCIMPPRDDILGEILAAKKRLDAGASPGEAAKKTRLDERSLTLILSRPAKTRAHTLGPAPREEAPVTGTRKALVLLVDFSDNPATQTQAHYTEMLFSVGTYASGSMRDFYREASYNKLDLTGVVSGTGGPTAGWYRAPHPKSYYTNGNYGFGSFPQNAQGLVSDLIDLAAPHVNFADFDNDGDGVVEALVVIAAGSGGEATGNVNDIWSHAWNIPTKTVDGVQIKNYFMAPEDGRVGVFSHELGHLLMRWPDYYDTDYSSSGTGRWDLMAGGSWNGGGDKPAHPNCLCKVEAGWINPVTIFNTEQTVTIKPYATNPQAYKLPIGSTTNKEYYLITNRHMVGFDSQMPGEGLIIEHVDENQANNTDENHYRVDIEQCDGKRDLNKGANRGDATDPFPCSTNTEFTKDTTPSSKAYDGSDTKISVKNIAQAGDDIQAVITVGEAVAVKKWFTNKAVTMTYASYHSQNAWAYIDTLGWRKIKPDSADGVTNLFEMCCEAVSNGKNVNAYADDSFIYLLYLV